jgi:hypothetical protein
MYSYDFYKFNNYEIWKSWYQRGFHIRNKSSRLFGFPTRRKAEEFIINFLESE